MAVKVRERDGAWWIFIDYKGRRKARRVGTGKVGMRAAKAAAEKIQAKLALGDTALLDETRDTAGVDPVWWTVYSFRSGPSCVELHVRGLRRRGAARRTACARRHRFQFGAPPGDGRSAARVTSTRRTSLA